MIKVWMKPHPDQATGQPGGINRVVENYGRYLPEFDVEIVPPDANSYDLRVGHAGSLGAQVDVEHNHGLWWTGDMDAVKDNHWRGNTRVIAALRAAGEVTVPSEWVAHNIARDMHLKPHVVPHGIDWKAWQHSHPNQGYVLWNKGRAADVCDPAPVHRLATHSRHTRAIQFVTTFCNEQASNIRVTGRMPFNQMKTTIQKAGVYLATAPETFGIGTLEAMAAGVPVLGWDHKGTAQLVTHQVNGYLARVGDYEDLAWGLVYCLSPTRRKRLGNAAKRTAKMYSWKDACRMVAGIYRLALDPAEIPGVTVVIPSYNYASSVARAIESALNQTLAPHQVIVVDDGSPDNGATQRVVNEIATQDSRVKYIRQDNYGVAYARNHGISLAETEYICCLDADDAIAPMFLETLVPALNDSPRLGVAYSSLMLISPDGKTRRSGWPPQCNYDQQLRDRNQVPTCCVFRKKAWRQVGGYRQRYAPQGCGTEDAAFWLVLGANGWQMRRVSNEPLFLYTVGGRTWDKNTYQKTDWLAWHPWTKDKIHPFASIAKPKDNRPSHPVYQYDEPEISVVIPIGPDHISIAVDALDSLEAQTFRKWEMIVVNDSGTPIDLTPWPYATIIETPGKKGAGFARNRGIEVSKADLFVCLDADDFLQADALERFLIAHQGYPDTWIYPDMLVYRGDGSLEHHSCSDFTAEELWRRGVAPVTCLYTKSMWEKVGGFSEESHREDWDFHLRLARAGICGIHLPEPLLTYRHGTGTRRRSGSHRKEIHTLHKLYNQRELEAMCRSCGKRTRNLPKSQRAELSPPQNWTAKDAQGWPKLEFVGGNKNSIVFKGKTGRRYLAGDNKHHKVISVHPDDYELLKRLRYFKDVTPSAQKPMEAVPRPPPSPPPASAPKPKPKTLADYTVSGILALDLSGKNLDELIEEEMTNKNRSTVIRYLERLKRREARRRDIENDASTYAPSPQ